MRVRALGAVLLLGLAACGDQTTQSVSSQPAPSGPARPAPAGGPVDAAAMTARWRVVKTAPGAALFRVGELVEFHSGGTTAAGPGLTLSPVTWTLDGSRLVLQTPTGPISHQVSLQNDLLRLEDPTGYTHVLRRFAGAAGPGPAFNSRIDQQRFVSLVATGRVETASLAQVGPVVTVTGVYLGERSAERYVVTLDDCNTIRSLGPLFRTNGVLADGLPPSEVEC